MPPSEGALLLLRKAAEDEALLDEVLESVRVTDAIFGFHAQQSAEKLLKAVLSQAGVLYPLTHRLGQLIDLTRDNFTYSPTHQGGLRFPLSGLLPGRPQPC